MATSLPRLVAFKSGDLYLQHIPSDQLVQLSSAMLLSERSFTKFEVVRTQSSNLVHIRSTYNNKFLRRRSNASSWVVPTADEPVADRSSDSCTLFRIIFNANSRVALYLQSPSGELAVGINQGFLFCSRTTPLRYFEAIDLNTRVLLPKHVSFKGNNDLYLSSRYIRTRNRLQFGSGNRLDPTVHQETFTLPNGDVRFRSITFQRFWRKSNPEWIWCDSNDSTANDSDTVFRPVRMNSQGRDIALLNLGNNKYCMRWIRGGQPRLIDTLTASASTLDPLAVVTVEEAIRDRQISNIIYKMDDVRIYNVSLVRSVPQTVTNWSFTETSNHTLSYTYTKLTQETFTSSHSWKVAYSAQLQVRVIPVLLEGQVTLDASYEGNVSWSEVHEESESVTSSVNVPVPPRTRSVVTMLVSRGSIDVPFSYKQRDILLDGRHVVYDMDDGLFTGLNTEVFDYDIREESLPDNASPLDGEEADDQYVVRRHYRLKASPSKEEEEERPPKEEEEEEEERPALPSRL